MDDINSDKYYQNFTDSYHSNNQDDQKVVTGVPYYPPYQSFEPEYYEKKAIKRTANNIGIGLLCFYIFSYVFQIILIVVLEVIGKSSVLNDSFFVLALNIVITVIGYIGVGIIIFKREKTNFSVFFGPPEKGKLLPLVMTGIGFCYVANVVLILIQNNLSWLGELKGNDIALPDGFLGFIFSVIAVAAFPALVEEFLFRGAIMGSLTKFGKPFAIFTSAVIFGLAHGNLVQIPFAFLVGLVLGFAVYESGSLWTSITIHFINNFISVCFDYFQTYFGETAANAVYMIVLLTTLVIGFFGIYFLCRKNDNIFKFKKTAHISTSKNRFWWTMGSASIVIYICIIGIEVLLNQFLY